MEVSGGGYAQVVPMSDINLHFTGDFHAITSAHNLLAAMVDNHLYWGHSPKLDARRITWRRAIDMNDRSLRNVVTGIGSVTNGFLREGRFDITAASEVMAILCLASNVHDLERRLANINLSYLESLKDNPDGRLILVTAITPTIAGEGKTTTSIGLVDGLAKLGKKAMAALREPSLGPCFGMKGGACGGGYAQVVPMSDINLHFTGDFHAITSAHNLLAAMVDNHLYWGHSPKLDARRITWRRAIDMNDRSLRNVVTGIGSVTNGFVRDGRFDITAASEVMAILCLASDVIAWKSVVEDMLR